MRGGRIGGWADGRIRTAAQRSAYPLIRSPALLIDAAPRSGAENMALDSAMLRAAQDGQASLRLYRWGPPCLSFGRNEPALTRYDRGRIERLGLDTVRRPTGGRAVWHDAEVTYAIAAPVDLFGSLAASYVAIHQMIARALAGLGVPCDLAPAPRSRLPAPSEGGCFANPVGGEVIADGRKLVGSAQVREGKAFLQHGSVLLEDGQHVVETLTRGPSAPPAATSLSAWLGRSVEFSTVARAIATSAGEAWGIQTAPDRSDAPDPAQVSQFSDPVWTWRR